MNCGKTNMQTSKVLSDTLQSYEQWAVEGQEE